MKKTLAVIAIILTIITTFVGCGDQQLGTVTMAGDSSEVIIDDGDAKEAMAEIDEDEKTSDKDSDTEGVMTEESEESKEMLLETP